MTNFSRTIFGKSSNDLTYQDIKDFFIDERGESNNIEFKAFSKTHGNFNDSFKGIIRAPASPSAHLLCWCELVARSILV